MASCTHRPCVAFFSALLLFCYQEGVARNIHPARDSGSGGTLLQGQRPRADHRTDSPPPQEVLLTGYDIPAELPKTSAGFNAQNLAALEVTMPRASSLPAGHRFFQALYQLVEAVSGTEVTVPRVQHPGPWRHDVFTSPREAKTTPQDTGFSGFFRSADYDEWCMLVIAVLGLIAFDGLFLKNLDHANIFTNVSVLGFWLVAAAIYNSIVFARMGKEAGIAWCSGYFLEWLLSLDNIFVFHLIFRLYKTPPKLLHKALFWGIIGAVLFRALFFMTLSTLLHLVHWFRFVFGVLLIYSGVQAASDVDDDDDPTESWPLIALKTCLGSRIDDTYDEEGSRLFIWKDDQFRATLLVPVIMCLEVTDVLFAVDSVSAKVAQIPDPYICYSSSVLAMFGLRAMFFVVRDLVDYFDLLKYGLCFVLVFIGLELMVADYVDLPAQVVLVVIISVFAICIAASAARKLAHTEKDAIASVVEANPQENKREASS